MIIINMSDDLSNAAEMLAIRLMVPELQERKVDLSDMRAVREALVDAHFGEALIRNCAKRAAAAARIA